MTVTITINMIITSFLGIVTIIESTKTLKSPVNGYFRNLNWRYLPYTRPISKTQNHQPDFFLKATGGRLQTIPAIFSTKSLTEFDQSFPVPRAPTGETGYDKVTSYDWQNHAKSPRKNTENF